MPGNQAFLTARGDDRVLEVLIRVESDRDESIEYFMNIVSDLVWQTRLKPALPNKLRFSPAKQLASPPVDERDASVGVNGNDDDPDDIQIARGLLSLASQYDIAATKASNSDPSEKGSGIENNEESQ